jgi:outer membrane protein OmpA-like peptidoglycan-associated protein
LDLFIGDISNGGELINVTPFSSKLNTRYHEADVAFTKDMKTVYFSRNNYFENKLTRDSTGTGLIHLYRAKIASTGEWVDVEPMPFNNDQYQTGHPTLSADEKTLYFISDMPGGMGKTDIYKSNINDDGSMGIPVNLGPKINTQEREMFSFISGNDELYFSSDGRTDGMGGLDIYVSYISKNDITDPLNLGEPLNSVKDDFSFILNYETRRGYFSSNRDGGKGDDDIYTFVQEIPIVFECNQVVKGVVIEKNTGLELPGSLVVLYDNNGVELDRTIVGEDARYHFEVTCNESFKLTGSKRTFSSDEKEFFSTEGDDIEIQLVLDKEEFIVERGKCLIKINPIYFDFDKSNIRPDAEIELQKVIEVMKKYPELIIEGGSHTDSRGTFKYNDALSGRRAKSTVQYIIDNGIDPNKISSKGYGETRLVNACSDGAICSEEAHQLNRRTEFVVVNYDEIKKKYPGICAIEAVSTRQLIKSDDKCKQTVMGKVFEKESGIILPGSTVIIYDADDNVLRNITVGENAEYEFEIECNTVYKLKGTKDNYSVDIKEFESTEGEILNIPLAITLEEFVVENGNCIVNINPIYFDFDKSNIRPDAEIELNKVVEVMKKYPEIIIEGGSHTDSRGTFKYNKSLSTRRAISTVVYIIENGINSKRISAQGYGETRLINGCSDGIDCTEKEHQFNRRTEFVIVNFDDIKKKYHEICAIRTTTTKEQIEKNVDIKIDERKKKTFQKEFKRNGSEILVRLEPIYFDLNSSYFRPDAAKELNKVVEIMLKYPNLIIECKSHTDAQASDNYNNWLSDKRAKRSVDYIISRGISSDRITGKGYGETQLVNRCSNGVKCSSKDHQLNRRTEFVILNPEIIDN